MKWAMPVGEVLPNAMMPSRREGRAVPINRLDPRKYGLPIICLVGPKGEILQAPFFSNGYDADPPQIMYQYQNVKAAIEKYLD